MTVSEPPGAHASLLKCLADDSRRRLLAALRSESPLSEGALAGHLAADPDSERAARLALCHSHLPALAEAGLVAWDREEGAVAVTDHSLYDDRRFDRLVEHDADDWSAVVDAFAHERRRAAVRALEAEGPSLSLAALARAVCDRTAAAASDRQSVAVSLYHVHLPKLDAAGVLEFDAAADRATYTGRADVDVAWFDDSVRESASALRAAAATDDVRSATGRQAVDERARSAVRAADDELCVLLSSAALLEGPWFGALEAVAAAGVDVYVGTGRECVRERVRERCPSATVWEPAFDWLEAAPRDERLSRLVLADREHVLVATATDVRPDGVSEETAVVGRGERNGLVVLFRDFLGENLDRLVERSDAPSR